MKTIYFKALVCLTSVSILAACAKDRSTDFNVLKSSEEKTNAAERMLSAGGFMHADKQFDDALKLNPRNPKARLYKALLAPAMLNRGILKRIEPLVSTLPAKNSDEYAKFEASIPAGDVRTFFFDGKADIATEIDGQNYIRAVQNKLRDLRKTLDELKNETIVLNIPIPKPGVTQADIARQCPVDKVGENQYMIADCPLQDIRNINVNFADIQAMRLYAAGTIVYLSMATAYDLTGLTNVVTNLGSKAKNGRVTDKQLVEAVQEQKSLGNLVDSSVLKEVLSFGAEGLEAVKFASANQGDLCRTGQISPFNRPTNLVAEGFCLDQKTAGSMVSYIEGAIRGPVIAPFGAPKSYETAVDITKPLNGSVPDLKALLPATFTRCGNASSIPDQTFGGLFPKGDATVALQAGDPTFLNAPCRR